MRNTKPFAYLPALDGIRALSILLVFISHQGFGKIVPGGLGVTIFFFLSGFLITNLLIAEYKNTNRIDLKSFYIRRMLRLYPALLLMIGLQTLFLTTSAISFDKKELFAAVFYYENYFRVFMRETKSHFSILWSLAVEEHFYLFFPLLFVALAKKPRALIAATLLLILVSLMLRFQTVAQYGLTKFSDDVTYFLSHTRFDSILFGCFLSMIINSVKKEAFLQFTSRYWVYGAALLLLVFTVVYRNEFFRQTIRYSIQGLAFLVLIPPIVYSTKYTRLNRLLSGSVLVFIGKMSYSIYLFHYVSAHAFTYSGFVKGSAAWVAGNIVVTLVLSLLSYYGVERKFMALRKKFGSNVNAAPRPQGRKILLQKEKAMA